MSDNVTLSGYIKTFVYGGELKSVTFFHRGSKWAPSLGNLNSSLFRVHPEWSLITRLWETIEHR